MEIYSAPCRFCAGRFAVAPGETRESERRRHESVCALSIDCPYCAANVGRRCIIRKTGLPSPTHRVRDQFAQGV